MTADKRLRGTPARPRDPLCPMCGDYPLDCEAVSQLVNFVHGLQLQEEGILTSKADAVVASIGEPEVGEGYLLTGAATMRANVALAVRRLMNAIRERRFPYGDQRLLVIVCTEDELRDAMREALDRTA